MLHGHCVGLGCMAAAGISRLRGMLSAEEVEDICSTFAFFKIPQTISGLSWEKVYQTTKSDKKMDSGAVKFILLRSVGQAYVDTTVSEDEMKAGYEFIAGKESQGE